MSESMQFKKQVGDYLIHLIRAVVKEEQPAEKPNEVSWEELYQLACNHKVEQMAYTAILKLDKKPQGDIATLWKDSFEKNKIIDLLQSGEAEEIIRLATKQKLYILSLKGSILKTLYPKTEYRQMADLDYLVDAKRIDEFQPLMEGLGYQADDVGLEDSHDVYRKRPYMEVEIHRRLLPPTEENHWHTDTIWERLVPDRENPYLLHMTIEDYYLYHLLHFEKHYSMGGSGIRSIIDQYYIMKEYREQLDWEYLRSILEKMNYTSFEAMCEGLSQAWFGEGEMTEELEEAAEFIINSGVFGTFEQFQEWSFERYKKEQGIRTKKGFFLRRMFMERERMEFIYPSLKKHGWLLPFFWIHRLLKSVFCNWERVKMEIKDIHERDDEN